MSKSNYHIYDLATLYWVYDESRQKGDFKHGKRRPVLIDGFTSNGRARVLKITSKFKQKSSQMQQNYCKIDHYQQAGLSKPSYIDVHSSRLIKIRNLEGKIGELDPADIQKYLLQKRTVRLARIHRRAMLRERGFER